MVARIVGVMGAGQGASSFDVSNAKALGGFIAKQGWITLCGGRDAGVMAAVAAGAARYGGTVIGILPGPDRSCMSPHVTIPIVTHMGNARNNINVLSSDVVVVMGDSAGMGTRCEYALAVKAGKPVGVLHKPGERPPWLVDGLAVDDLVVLTEWLLGLS